MKGQSLRNLGEVMGRGKCYVSSLHAMKLASRTRALHPMNRTAQEEILKKKLQIYVFIKGI